MLQAHYCVLEASALAEALVHTQQIACEDGGFVAACARAELDQARETGKRVREYQASAKLVGEGVES